MIENPDLDLYEILQVSPNAELETIQRVYRLLAQRLHPDNQATGDAERFRLITAAYQVLSDPEARARYDITRPQRDQQRARLIAEAVRAQNHVESEQLVRLTVLEILYARRRMEPRSPGMYDLDLEELVGWPREHLQFTIWYLAQKGFIDRADSSRLVITAQGVDHFEQNCTSLPQLRQLAAGSSANA